MGNTSALFTRHQPGGMFCVFDAAQTTGNIFFVHSGTGTDSAGFGQNPDAPFATLDYAIGQCTASKGDVVVVMEGHTETASTDAQELWDIDVAGVTVLGLGVGDKRPTFTLAHANATVVMGAAGCRISNLRIIGNISDLVTGLEVEAAATGCVVDHCYFADSATNKDMLIAIAVEADADRLIVEHNHFVITVGGEATDCIKFAGGSDGSVIRHNIMVGDWKTGGAINNNTAASLGQLIHDNFMVNADASAGLCIKHHASSTGGIFRNFVAGSKANTETISTVTAMHCGENYGNEAAATSGILTPSTATNWSS